MAKELAAKGVRVNCVAPGLIGQTSFHDRFTPRATLRGRGEDGARWAGRARPRRSARVIAFLCGPDSAYLAGETIEINGGMLMR